MWYDTNHRQILIAGTELWGKKAIAQRLSDFFGYTPIEDLPEVIQETRLWIPSKDNETDSDDSKQESDWPDRRNENFAEFSEVIHDCIF